MVCLKKHRLRSWAKFYKLSATLGISYFTADILNIHFLRKTQDLGINKILWAGYRKEQEHDEKEKKLKRLRGWFHWGNGLTHFRSVLCFI